MECSKSYQVTIDPASTACCLVDTTSIATTIQPQGMCYAVTDNRIFAPLDNAQNDIDVIDPATDTVVTTILGVGTVVGYAVYSSVNNRVYVTDLATLEVHIINPTLMTHIGTIPAPAGISGLGEPSYDTTNDLIYIPGNTATDAVVYVLDPIGGTINALISDPIAPMSSRTFGRRVDHCTLNNRIYVSMFTDDGVGGFALVVRGYSAAGVLQTTINVPGVVSSSVGVEQVYWNSSTGLLYLLADTAVADAPGAVAINPTSELVEGSMPTGFNNTSCMGFSPDCGSINIFTPAGIMMQFDESTYASICDHNLTTAVTNFVQMATAANGNVYVPDFNSSTIHSFHVPP